MVNSGSCTVDVFLSFQVDSWIKGEFQKLVPLSSQPLDVQNDLGMLQREVQNRVALSSVLVFKESCAGG